MQHQAEDGPPGDRNKTPVRASRHRRSRENQQVRISTRRNLAEQRVDAAPDVDLEAEPLDGYALHEPLEYVSAEDSRDQDPKGTVVKHMACMGEAEAPGDVPKGRVNE